MTTATLPSSQIIDAKSLRTAREIAYADFREHQSVRKLTKQLSKLSDQLLMSLWQACELDQEAALVAVGGFGRAALFPYSDIDILILLPDNKQLVEEVLSGKIEKFVAHCWDTGLEIGSSVRTVAQCINEAEQDITVRTSLLEARLIGGKKTLFKDFAKAFEASLAPKAIALNTSLPLRMPLSNKIGTFPLATLATSGKHSIAPRPPSSLLPP